MSTRSQNQEKANRGAQGTSRLRDRDNDVTMTPTTRSQGREAKDQHHSAAQAREKDSKDHHATPSTAKTGVAHSGGHAQTTRQSAHSGQEASHSLPASTAPQEKHAGQNSNQSSNAKTTGHPSHAAQSKKGGSAVANSSAHTTSAVALISSNKGAQHSDKKTIKQQHSANQRANQNSKPPPSEHASAQKEVAEHPKGKASQGQQNGQEKLQ